MKRIASALLISCVLAGSIGDVRAESCNFPLVTKKSVALGIFASIVSGLETAREQRKYETVVKDDGASWTLFQDLLGGRSYRRFRDSKGRDMEP